MSDKENKQAARDIAWYADYLSREELSLVLVVDELGFDIQARVRNESMTLASFDFDEF